MFWGLTTGYGDTTLLRYDAQPCFRSCYSTYVLDGWEEDTYRISLQLQRQPVSSAISSFCAYFSNNSTH